MENINSLTIDAIDDLVEIQETNAGKYLDRLINVKNIESKYYGRPFI